MSVNVAGFKNCLVGSIFLIGYFFVYKKNYKNIPLGSLVTAEGLNVFVHLKS